MSLFAEQFFQQELRLPYVGTVVADTYYALPSTETPARLRLDFQRTVVENEYDGLRLTTVHPTVGQIDTVTLSFAEHGVFRERDTGRTERWGHSQNGCFTDRGSSEPPWKTGDFAAVRDAVNKYVQMWFVGATPVPTGTRVSRVRGVRKLPDLPTRTPSSPSR
ncbi:hypothetical protein [Streptomyces sp. NPDC051561]|uniref:hypothetical protein n=1 Tax=Streptomyces sp. NPDC051561 TaxID=3365658 RepID=UPI00379C754A